MLQKELARYFPEPVGSFIYNEDKPLTEICFRANRPVQLVYFASKDKLIGEPMDAAKIKSIALGLMEHSYYACEEELNKGFFTMKNGCRVGVGGSFSSMDGKKYHLRNIGSMCVRIARAVPGCSADLIKCFVEGRPENMLILSAPGKGKTTILRDIARLLSCEGYKVGIADERHEIAGCVNGTPFFDIGLRSDVVDGCPKAVAMEMLIRTMSPDVIVTDEIGNTEDYTAITEAARRGVAVIASAHASSYEEFERGRMGLLLRECLFRHVVLLGKVPGCIQEIRKI